MRDTIPDPWWRRPVACLFGRHVWRCSVGHWWLQYCVHCPKERNVLP